MGTSTLNFTGYSLCEPCRPGQFGNKIGQPQCGSCSPGHYSSETNSSQCEACEINSFQPEPGASKCTECPSDEYVVYDTSTSEAALAPAPRVSGKCHDCPAFASCQSGNITATQGFYLLIDQQAATVSAVQCSRQACVDANSAQCSRGSTPTAAVQTQLILSSQLPVVNCCGPGRLPAYLAEYEADSELAATDGVNVLCAACQPDYTQMGGVCVHCPAVNWAR